MSTLHAVEDLRRRHGDESTHTNHVAGICRRLFDRTHRAVGVPAEEWRLLEAACLLHDIGYRLDPPNHAWMSARLIIDYGLKGFTADERDCIAGTVLFHQRKLEFPMATAFARTMSERERAMRLAAYLRIADGLDHGHLQDVSIRSIRRDGNVFAVDARVGWYAGNVPRAEVKADLWRKVFSVGIEFRGRVPAKVAGTFVGVVFPHEALYHNLRRLLFALYRTMLDTREAVLLSDDPLALHDLRVSVRRFKAALTFCKPLPMEMKSVQRVERSLEKILDGLGQARDADVWWGFLQTPKYAKEIADDPKGEAFLAAERARRVRKGAKLKAFLRSEEWATAMGVCGWFVRVLLPEYLREYGPGVTTEIHAVTKLREELSKIEGMSDLAEKSENDHKLHALRRAVRQGRYWAEFSLPLSEEVFGALVTRLRAVTHALGELHDMCLFFRRLEKSGSNAPAKLTTILRARRKRWLDRFRRSWAALFEGDFRRQTERKFNALAKEERL